MGHVARRVLALGLGEGAAQPIGEPVALRHLELELALHERHQRRRAVAHEPRRHLGVEEVGGDRPAGAGQHVEVLLGGVEHRHRRALQQRHQPLRLAGQGIDEGDPGRPGDLHEGETREVRAFAMELGVERVARLDRHLGHEVGQRLVRVDPAVVQDGGSTSVSRPLSCQASVPPATLITSNPRVDRSSAARMLRAPLRHTR